MCISRLQSKSPDLLCHENFFEAIEEDERDFNDRDVWQAEVNSWSHVSAQVYHRDLILEQVNFVPDWVFETRYVARKYEDPTNDNLMICSNCFERNHGGVADIWIEDGLVQPFDFMEQIYENEQLWCAYCDKSLFYFETTD